MELVNTSNSNTLARQYETMSWFERLRNGLEKTRGKLIANIERAISGKCRIDEELLEELEEILIGGDLGVEATSGIIEQLKGKVKEGQTKGAERTEQLLSWLKEILKDRLKPAEGSLTLRDDGEPSIYLVMGVNGSGKTTTIAKLAQRFKQLGREKVVFAAADTFRAAAIEQLQVWAERVGAEVIKHRSGADPSAVAYDAVDHALNKGRDVVLIDTAGRLQTRYNLMEELKKINRVIEKRLGREIDERLLVLDATTGQNAISQAQKFNDAVSITGIVLTKLDSTARGGVIIPIVVALGIPIKLIGVGEQAEDLHEFNRDEFVQALF